MTVWDFFAWVFTVLALVTGIPYGLAIAAERPPSTGGLVKGAVITAAGALVAGYLLASQLPPYLRVFLVVYARLSVIATVGLLGWATLRGFRAVTGSRSSR